MTTRSSEVDGRHGADAPLPHHTDPSCCDKMTRRANHQFGKTEQRFFDSSSSLVKNIIVVYKANHFYKYTYPVPMRGALANVANVGQAAVDARALRDGQQSGGRPSRVVLAPRRWCQVCGKQFPQAMVANKPGTPGRARSNRKTTAQGMPGDSGGPVRFVCLFSLLACEVAGASCARHFPRPLVFEGRKILA